MKITQIDDKELNAFIKKSTTTIVDDVGIVQLRGRLCVPNDEVLKKSILEEAHCSKFSINPRVIKIYQVL